jgi:hypothetical protein
MVVASVVVAASFAVLSAVGVAAHASASTSSDRWGRAVCRDVSTWLDAKVRAESQAQQVLGGLTTGNLSATTAKRQLARAYADGVRASSELLEGVESAGVPKLDQGKVLASEYRATLGGYRAAYAKAAAALSRASTREKAQFIAVAQQVDTTLANDLQVVGTDPVEDLRAVQALAPAISGSCAPVEQYLAKTIDTGCSGALDQAQRVVDAENTFQAAPAGSPEETASADAYIQTVAALGGALASCTVPGIASVPCRTVLETAQSIVAAEDRFQAAAVDSPEETAAGDDADAATRQLVSQIAGCPRNAT